MKPKTPVAMQQLIQKIRQALPFELPEAYACSGVCKGCSLKLLDYLDMELVIWEERLKAGDVPGLGDIKKIASTSRKIHRVLDKNNVLDALSKINSNNLEASL